MSSTTMAESGDLPAEIIDGIVAAVNQDRVRALSAHQTTQDLARFGWSCKESTCTLLSLCLTSKKFHALTEPHLYRVWDANRRTFTSDMWSDTSQESLQRFLRAIVLRPELSKHVQNIGASNWRICGPKDDDSLLSVEDQDFLCSIAEEKGIPGLDRWRAALKAGSADPLIALLLALTPNLRNIFFEMPPGSFCPRDLFGLAVSRRGRLLENANMFTKLQKISYRVSDFADDQRLRFNETLPFFFLPSMKAITTQNSWDPYGPQSLDENRKRIYYPLPNGTSSITKIEMNNISIKPRIVEGILRSCRALESLSISYNLCQLSNDANFPYGSDCLVVVNPQGLGDALSCVKHSLQHLKLRIKAPGYYNYMAASSYNTMFRPLGSLRSFERLSTLDVSLFMLLGSQETSTPRLVSLLPASLELLRLDDDDELFSECEWTIDVFLTHLTAFSVDGPPLLPKLQCLDMSRIRGDLLSRGLNYEAEEEELSTAFEKAGIKLIGWW